MKKTLFAISAIAVLLGFTACTSENETLEPQVSGKTILKAYTEENTRTALSQNGAAYDVVWSEGDAFKIGENTFTLEEGAGTTSGTFESMTSLTNGNYTAYYPTTYDGTTWPTAQTYTAGNITGSPMKATFKDTKDVEPSLSFKNEGGILRLKLKGTAKVKSITISATELTNPITLNCGSTGVELNTTTATPFHIAVPGADGEGNAYSGLKIVMTDDAGAVCTKTLKSDKTITVQRSKITDISLTASEFKADIPEGALPGLFSVSETKKVRFSKGNLWADSDNALHFEANQYSSASTKDATHVSHFTWSSTVGAAVGNSYSGDYLFCDENHKVSVDESDAIYYALSNDEWEYLFNNHSHKRVTVNGVNGYVIAPDGFTGTLADSYADDAALATDNLVFLPAAGYCYDGHVEAQGGDGRYWSSTPNGNSYAYSLDFGSGNQSVYLRYGGFSVRAVLNESAE